MVAKDGELFLVMEYAEGESLSRLMQAATVRKDVMPIPIVAAVMSGVLHGLHAAHEAKNERGEKSAVDFPIRRDAARKHDRGAATDRR